MSVKSNNNYLEKQKNNNNPVIHCLLHKKKIALQHRYPNFTLHLLDYNRITKGTGVQFSLLLQDISLRIKAKKKIELLESNRYTTMIALRRKITHL